MTSPLEHPDNYNPDPDQRRRVETVLAAYVPELEGSEAARLAERLVPVVPDGGRVGRTLEPHLDTLASTRASLLRWAPAAGTSAAVFTTALTVSLPPPLLVYGTGLAGFTWWHCCGRPGPIAMIRRAADLLTDAAAALRAARLPFPHHTSAAAASASRPTAIPAKE
ncbi:hypothetical protein [Nocardia transvalensis]|uniref:hypothetical protein n=1 Tax=Nocardia transvalensis TaxID=37333 RepID=UPI0018950229|nr:hypothetical protein [Nocardia transvalensis]MBF6333651.1 hypothetical protein [Nocardia transvalensis]